MKVKFTAKNGASKLMPLKHAQILQKLGKGTFDEAQTPHALDSKNAPKAKKAPKAKG